MDDGDGQQGQVQVVNFPRSSSLPCVVAALTLFCLLLIKPELISADMEGNFCCCLLVTGPGEHLHHEATGA